MEGTGGTSLPANSSDCWCPEQIHWREGPPKDDFLPWIPQGSRGTALVAVIIDTSDDYNIVEISNDTSDDTSDAA